MKSKIQEIIDSGQCPATRVFRKPYMFKGKTVRAFNDKGKEIPASQAKNQWPNGNTKRVRELFHARH